MSCTIPSMIRVTKSYSSHLIEEPTRAIQRKQGGDAARKGWWNVSKRSERLHEMLPDHLWDGDDQAVALAIAENERLQREKDARLMCDHNSKTLTLGEVQKRLERLEAERNLYRRALEELRAKGPSHHHSTYVDRLVGDALRSADLVRKGR